MALWERFTGEKRGKEEKSFAGGRLGKGKARANRNGEEKSAPFSPKNWTIDATTKEAHIVFDGNVLRCGQEKGSKGEKVRLRKKQTNTWVRNNVLGMVRPKRRAGR